MSKTNLVIVESPAKAKTIGKYLGRDYEVMASMGHIRDLPKSKLGVDIEAGFVPDYQPIKGKEELIETLQKAASDSDKVYLATDPDREGEAISWHLKELLKIPDDKTYRVTFNEITKKVVSESIAAPPGHRPGSGGRPAGPAYSGPDCGLSALPPAVAQGAPGPVRRPGPVAWPPAWWWNGRRRSGPSSRQEYWTMDVDPGPDRPPDGLLCGHVITAPTARKRRSSTLRRRRRPSRQSWPRSSSWSSSRQAARRSSGSPPPPFTTSTLQQEASRKLNMPPSPHHVHRPAAL